MLYLAGHYSRRRSLEGDWHLTATILTRDAAGLMAELHHRMLVFVTNELLHA